MSRPLYEYALVDPAPDGAMITFHHPSVDVHSGTHPGHHSAAIQMLLKRGWEPCGIAPDMTGCSFVHTFRRPLETP